MNQRGNLATEDRNLRCLVCPADTFQTICDEYPKVSDWMYKRALTRRNSLKYIESAYNKEFNVTRRGYDFLYAIAKTEHTRELIR